MSRYITTHQLAHQRRVLAPAMMDTAQRLIYSAGTGGYGHDGAFAEGALFACSFQGRAKPDVLPGTDVMVIDGELYCAHDTTLLPDDRVRLTHVLGEALATAQTYAIVAGPIVQSNVMIATLRLVTE